MAWQVLKGMNMAVHMSGCAGGALKLCQLNQGTVAATWQKAMASLSSASTTTDAAAQTELWWEHATPRCQVAGCALLLHQCEMAAASTLWEEHPGRGTGRAPGGGEQAGEHQGV